jgi:hypothetical protein
VLVYPLRHKHHLKPGPYKFWARWEGAKGNGFDGNKKIEIDLDTKPIAFEYQGKPAVKTP